MPTGISSGLGGGGGRIGALYTGNLYNLYIDCLGWSLLPKGGMAVG